MPFLLMRSFNDAQAGEKPGTRWIERLKGHKVDDTLGPWGGIFFETFETDNPNAGGQQREIVEERDVERIMRPGDDESPRDRIHLYTVKATLKDAYALVRPDWTVVPVASEAIARALFADPAQMAALLAKAGLPVAPPVATVEEEEEAPVEPVAEPVAEPEIPAPLSTADPSKMTLRELKGTVKGLIEAGGPAQSLTAGRGSLEAYVNMLR